MAKVLLLLGLPRTGTTLLTSVLSTHSRIEACFEPWNRQPESDKPSPYQTPEALFAGDSGSTYAASTVFLIKETSADFRALLWAARFADFNAKSHQISVLVPIRDIRHAYLSFMEAGREDWSNEQMVVSQRSYERWLRKARASMALIGALHDRYTGVVYTYESLTHRPEATLKRLCKALDIAFEETLLSHHEHVDVSEVHGDRKYLERPTAPDPATTDRRAAEWSQCNVDILDPDLKTFSDAFDELFRNARDSTDSGLKGGRKLASYAGVSVRDCWHGVDDFDWLQGATRAVFRQRSDWQTFVGKHRHVFSNDYIQDCVRYIDRQGFLFDDDWVKPDEIHLLASNPREGLLAREINSRKRAVLFELLRLVATEHRSMNQTRVYATESMSHFADYLFESFPRFVGSEYLESEAARNRFSSRAITHRKTIKTLGTGLPGKIATRLLQWFSALTKRTGAARTTRPIQHQDLMQLTFADRSFDVVIANDVFEHIPFLDKAIGECARVLDNGGKLIATFPFAIKQDDTLQKATLSDDGSINYLDDPPEYHEDPLTPKGALVFQVPGWDILQTCRDRGFSDAYIVFLESRDHGIVSSFFSGHFILVAVR